MNSIFGIGFGLGLILADWFSGVVSIAGAMLIIVSSFYMIFVEQKVLKEEEEKETK